MIASEKDLAKIICAMSYGALRQVASELADMCHDKDARPELKTTEQFADMLYDWAEAQNKE